MENLKINTITNVTMISVLGFTGYSPKFSDESFKQNLDIEPKPASSVIIPSHQTTNLQNESINNHLIIHFVY